MWRGGFGLSGELCESLETALLLSQAEMTERKVRIELVTALSHVFWKPVCRQLRRRGACHTQTLPRNW